VAVSQADAGAAEGGGGVTKGNRSGGQRGLPNYPILKGHNRKRKKLIPPVLAIGNTNLVSTIDTITPEIIWIGTVLDWHGIRDGIESVSSFLKALFEIDETKNWYRFSEISSNPNVIEQVSQLSRDSVQIAFLTFREVYEWPGLDWANGDIPRDDAARRIIKTVENYTDRFEQPYLIALSTIIYSMALAGKMQFAPGTLPDIEAIVNDWGTDAAEQAAGSVRACSMAFFPNDGSIESEKWCKHFWRRNYQLSGCR